MKPLSSSKNMPSIERKFTRKYKDLPTVHTTQNINWNEVQQLIFKIELLPIIFEFQTSQRKELRLNISNASIQIKHHSQVLSSPLNIGKVKWMRMFFGQEIRNLEVKNGNDEKKIEKNQMYTKYQGWNSLFKEQTHNLHLQSFLLLMKKKNQSKYKLANIQPKNSLSSFIKSRFSQKSNLNQNLLPFRTKYETYSNVTQNQIYYPISTNTQQNAQKTKQKYLANKRQSQHGLSTLNAENQGAKGKYCKDLKQSNTSTAISVEPDVNFGKKMKRTRGMIVDIKAQNSQKQAAFCSSQLFQLKALPKFYQHVNLSQQQIQTKRKKFDSQFICRKEIATLISNQMSCLEKNVSEVSEDICKMQNSKKCNQLQDTLQKGFTGSKEAASQIQESGTLYESVYE